MTVLRFWGVRGSIPCPGPATVRYGGNTSCVTLENAGGLVVLDAGTGIRPLALALRKAGAAVSADLLLTHTHWDHIQGLPFFFPLYDTGTRVRIHGPRQAGGLRAILERQMMWENFPIPSSAQVGIESINELEPGPFEVAGWRAGAFVLCHAGHTLGYRLDRPGAGVAFVTDNELAGGAHGIGPGWRDRLVDFLKGVDTLVHDTTWADDRLGTVAGWGHSTSGEAIALARDASCRRLVLFHHDPDHDDAALDRKLAAARATASATAPGVEIVAAIEGESLVLEE